MGTLTQVCTVCSKEFTPQFRYQMEEQVDTDANGQPRARFAYFCSQSCLEKSHRGDESGAVTCDACAASFRVELASQVVFVGGRRRYACSADCRAQVLQEARGVRLGDARLAAEADPPQSAPRPTASAAAPEEQPPSESTEPRSEPPTPPGEVVPLRPSAAAAPGSAPTKQTGDGTRAPSVPRVLAVFNHKGGTGKTTTSVTLAAGLAAQGQRVLLVDTDGQGNVGVSLGLKSERSLYHVLVMGLGLSDAITSPRDNLDVLPSNETLAAAELYLAGRRNRDRVLANRLSGAREAYDYVIVDCSPSLSLMNQNALCFADSVLCPVACDYLSLVGVRQVLRTIKQVNKLLAHPVQLWGVLPTMYDARARICHEALDTLREHFRDRCLTPIRSTIRVKEAPSQGRTLFEHAPESSAAEDYLAVVERLLAERTQAAGGLANRAVGGVR